MEIHNHNAIIHLDADAFFASCEQATHPEYKGKPVITGKERGIVSAASYEAKERGVQRGVPLHQVKEICPDAIIVPSDYETYSLFSKRIFSIMRRFTSQVEEYSIDEAFADVTGLRRPLKMSYPEIAIKMKETIEAELGLTVSVGLSVNKVLAKIAAKWNKPSGFMHLSLGDAVFYLSHLPVEKVWGIGPQTSSFLAKNKIYTAGQFATMPWNWIKQNLTKPHQEIWRELNGETVYEVNTEEASPQKSISKFKTFTPARRDRSFIFSQLSKNVENAFIKARRHKLVAKKITIVLRTQDFHHFAIEGKFSRPTAFPPDALRVVSQMFEKIYRQGLLYRATGVVVSELEEDLKIQMNLFEDPIVLAKTRELQTTIDVMAQKYGKHTLHYGSSFLANKEKAHLLDRGDIPEKKVWRKNQVYQRKFLNLPFMGKVG